MENKNYTIEGLTFERIKSLLELEFNYKKLLKDLNQKEDDLKQKYKVGTVEFIFGVDNIYSPYFKKFILNREDAMSKLKKTLEDGKKQNEKLTEKIKELEEKIINTNSRHDIISDYIHKIKKLLV